MALPAQVSLGQVLLRRVGLEAWIAYSRASASPRRVKEQDLVRELWPGWDPGKAQPRAWMAEKRFRW